MSYETSRAVGLVWSGFSLLISTLSFLSAVVLSRRVLFACAVSSASVPSARSLLLTCTFQSQPRSLGGHPPSPL